MCIYDDHTEGGGGLEICQAFADSIVHFLRVEKVCVGAGYHRIGHVCGLHKSGL